MMFLFLSLHLLAQSLLLVISFDPPLRLIFLPSLLVLLFPFCRGDVPAACLLSWYSWVSGAHWMLNICKLVSSSVSLSLPFSLYGLSLHPFTFASCIEPSRFLSENVPGVISSQMVNGPVHHNLSLPGCFPSLELNTKTKSPLLNILCFPCLSAHAFLLFCMASMTRIYAAGPLQVAIVLVFFLL